MTNALRSFRAVVAAGPDMGLAILFFYTWVHPTILDDRMVPFLVSVYLLEMVVVFSLIIDLGMAGEEKPVIDRLIMVAKVIGVGTIAVTGFALSFASWYPLLSYWGLALNKLSPAFLPHADSQNELSRTGARLGLGALIYFVLAFATVFIPLPQLGVTESLTSFGMEGGGVWFDEPHVVMAAGGLYFFLLGLLEAAMALGFGEGPRLEEGQKEGQGEG